MRPLFTTLLACIVLGTISVLPVASTYAQGTQVPRNYGTTSSPYGYMEYLPPDYNVDPTHRFPIIIFLHGIGETGNGIGDLPKVCAAGPPYLIKNNKWPVKSPATGQYPAETFIVLSPQNASGFFNPDILHKFIEYAKGAYRCDPDRVFVTGLSAGGISIWNYLNKYVDQAAAVISIAGNGNSVAGNACIFKVIPHWAFHGDADPQVNTGGSINPIKKMNACVPPPVPLQKVTIYNGVGHNSWARTYDLTGMSKFDPTYDPFDISIYDWLLKFKRPSGTTPIVSAGPDININLPTNSTTITGTASTPTGTITSYAWTQVSGPAATLANASTPTVSITDLVQGVYVFRLTVTNSAGETAYDEVKVTVILVNQIPVANAGPDITLTLPTNAVNITGTGTDADGTIASYQWVQVSGPVGTISGLTTPTLVLTNLVQGTYTFSFTVTDNLGATATDQVKVIVNLPAVNQPPTANAGVDKTINLPTSSTNLTGSGSDPDGSIASYLWEKVSGPAVTITNATSPTVSLSSLVAGVYVFRLTVTDNLGATGTDQATVTVVAANQSPIANAGADIIITLPTSSTNISGSGSDPDGSIAAYKWTQVTGPSTATLSNAATPTVTAGALVQGTYTFRLTITDDKGSTGFDDVKVTVNAAPVNVAPTANAGPDKSITLPTNSVVLNGTGTDTDGTIASYAWTLVSGPAATLSNQNTANLTASNLVAGTYVFRLTVTDNQGATGTDNVTVTVQPAIVNQSPVANAGADVTLTLPTNSVNLNGSGTDADGTIATYAWTKTSGPAATLTNANTATLSLTNLVAGTYVFQLTVTDDKGATDSDDVTVTVNAANQPPVADAGPDITINLPTSSTIITGSATDADGSVATYAWSQVSGPNTAGLVNANTAVVTASGLAAGTYVFRLTVTDDDGAPDTDDVKVIVNAANQTPTASAGPNKTITLPTNSANFTGSGTDTDGTITTYAWTQTGGPAATLSNANTATLTVTVTIDGTYTFRLVVTDNGGATDFDDVVLTVNPAIVNQAPIADAGANQSITLPLNSVTLTGTGSDPDGSIASYQWSKISGPTATLTNATTSVLSLSDLVEGTYTFRLTVTDNGGLTATDDVTVTVLPAAVNQPPVANAGVNKTLTLPTNTITLFGTGTDADGTVVTYAWVQLSGPAGTLANENTPNLSLSNLVQGTYTFQLTVTDDDGATDSDNVTVIVNAAATNQNPVANAGPDKTISLPTNITNLTGTGSDADGSIVRYDWVKVSGPTVTLGATNQPTLSLSDLVEGTYVFRLEVEDDDAATDTDDVTVTVLPQATNQAPVVSAGADKTIFLPNNSVIITGSASDPDGSIASYQWTQVAGAAAILVNETSATVTISGLAEGTYRFRLTVADNSAATSFDEVVVTVNAATANQPPIANAGADVSIKLPTNFITLTGSATDIDGTIAGYAWVKVSGPAATLSNQATSALTVSNMVEGVYVFELTATDNSGDSDTDPVQVTVLPAAVNTPPVVSAGADISISLPTNSTVITGTATDDGTIASLQWTQVSGAAAGLSGDITTTLTVTGLAEGTYVFQLTATDDGGLTDSDVVTVVVLPEIQSVEPPTVDAGDDQTIQLPESTATFVALGDSPNGVVESYEWTQTAGEPVTFDVDSSTLVLDNLVAGSYAFTVTVTDNFGLTATDEVSLTVLEAEPFAKPHNVFTPDNRGDITTETWTIDNADLLNGCEVVVYNRQGQRVYTSQGYPTPWDGTLNGKPVPDGAYFYVIKCSSQQSQTGSVTIVRAK